MKAVDDDIQVFFAVIIADDGHGVAILPDAGMQKLHFRGRNPVGIVFICVYGFLFYPEYAVRRLLPERADLGDAVTYPVDGVHLFV